MNPTIKDVAQKANVSIATVSRVLNNLSGYSDKTKQKVNEAIKDLGYQPNAIARGLINKRTQTIGVMFPSVSGAFSSDLLKGIEELANDRNYSVMVCNTDQDGKRTLKYLQLLREKQVDGIIYSSEVLKKEYYDVLETMKIPVVLVSSQTEFASVPYVKVDDYQAAYDATLYLISKGHSKIAMISGNQAMLSLVHPEPRDIVKRLKRVGFLSTAAISPLETFCMKAGALQWKLSWSKPLMSLPSLPLVMKWRLVLFPRSSNMV